MAAWIEDASPETDTRGVPMSSATMLVVALLWCAVVLRRRRGRRAVLLRGVLSHGFEVHLYEVDHLFICSICEERVEHCRLGAATLVAGLKDVPAVAYGRAARSRRVRGRASAKSSDAQSCLLGRRT